MLTADQAMILREILRKFNNNEVLEWTSLDENMLHLQELSDSQLAVEADVMHQVHVRNGASCSKNRLIEASLVPTILDGVDFILDDFEENGRLAKKTRYILEYYLSLSHANIIVWR